MDWCLLAYGILTSILYIHLLAPDGTFYPFTFANVLRRTLTFLIAVFAPYFLISRTSRNRPFILDSLAAFALPCVVMAVIGIFEKRARMVVVRRYSECDGTLRVTLLRTCCAEPACAPWPPRDARCSWDMESGQQLWLWLWSPSVCGVPRPHTDETVSATLPVPGLLASYSRGPWACAIGIYTIFVFQKPRAVSGLIKSFLSSLFALALISMTPLARKIADVLPFLGGTIDTANIDYRNRLWSQGWSIVRDNPAFGDQYALARMQNLRQGQVLSTLLMAIWRSFWVPGLSA